MRKIYVFLMGILLLSTATRLSAQVSAYGFAESSGSYAALGGTNSTATGDDGSQNGISIGFNFTYGGSVYTHFCINTNGWIRLGTAATTIGAFSYTNLLSNTATHAPLIAAIWDDNHRNTGAITYSLTGAPGSQVLTVDWNNVNIGGGGSTSAANLASYQIKLYETTNVIEIIYGTLNLAGTLTASIGLNDLTSFLSVTPGAPGTASGSTANNSLAATTNVTNKKYTFSPPSCLPAGGLSASAITTTTATVNWTAVGGASGYEYAVTTSATPPASGTATALLTANVSSLTPSSVYYLHVRTSCGATFSNWSTITFNTACGAAGIPYTENFDAVTAPALPPCVTKEDVNGGTTWNVGTTSPRSAPNCMIYNYSTPLPGDDWFYTAPLALTGGISYRLTFYYKARSATFPEAMEVKYGTSGAAASMTNNLLSFPNIDQTTYQQGFVDFTPGVTGTYYIGFHSISIADEFDLNVDDISVTVTPSCGEPTALNVSLSSNTAGTASWVAPGVGTPTGYEYVVDNSAASPAGAGTATAGTSVPLTGLTPFTSYYLHVRTDCGGTFSSWAVYNFFTLINDAPCGAIPLTLGGPADCGNTTNATSSGDPALFCSSPNNTVWYKYTPAANGSVDVILSQNGGPAGQLNGWIQFYTATGSCPTLTLTQLNASACVGSVDLTTVASGTVTSPALTGGVTYYIVIDGFSGATGAYCISLAAPPPPPGCTTNLLPANGATGVVIGAGVSISWNAAPTATSYDVYFSTVNPPVTNIGNTTGTSATITGLAINTTYYWYVVPKNGGGDATGCSTSTTSFTTENPSNCAPIYTDGCDLADSLSYFSLKGEPGSAIYNNSGDVCSTTPFAYSDFTAAFSPVTMSTGNAYSGFLRTGDPNDYATMWIDYNDNGFFESTERIMNNLKVGTSNVLYSIFIPTTATLGTHRLRIRVVYYGVSPTVVTDPCNTYVYGETEDYLVNIVNTGAAARNVATGTPGSCITGAAFTVDAESNNIGATYLPVVDSLNNFIVQLYPQGNKLGRVRVQLYVNSGSVRQDPTGKYYLDRNLTIKPDTTPTGPYNMRFFYMNSELNALIAQPGSGVTSQFDLAMSKTIQDTCSRGVGANVPLGQFYFPTGWGGISGDRFVDVTNISGFSTFFLHGGTIALPVGLLSFSGERTGAVNQLHWTTSTEANSRGFAVQRSADGINYVTLGFVNSQAAGGNSQSNISYSYTDNSPSGNKQYYRLKLVDMDNNSRLSNIVMIKSDKPVVLGIDGIFPNPANSVVNLNVQAPASDNITAVVTDISGKVLITHNAHVEAGSNTVQLDVSRLVSGTYLVKLICKANCESVVGKFVKQ